MTHNPNRKHRMYTIDLLKGTRLPRRSAPLAVALTMLSLLLPIIVGALLVTSHIDASHQMAGQKLLLDGLDRKLDALAPVRQLLAQTDARKDALSASLREVGGILSAHGAWSPAILELARSVPAGMTVSRIELKREKLDKRPQHAGRVRFTLHVGLYVPSSRQTAASIHEFIRRLQLPTALGANLEHISVVFQQRELLDDVPYTFYLVECVIKQEAVCRGTHTT
jgi:hypothetical protein